MLNEIKTYEGYLAEGFKPDEIPLAERSDRLFNQWKLNGYLKPRKKAEYFEIVKRLGL